MGIWNKRTLCLVTGASQGIGREIALQFSQNVSSDSTIILSARSEKGLAETAALISEAQPQITTKLFPYDMSNPKLEDFKSFLANYSSSEWDLYLLVHNAGSEGSGNFLKDCERPDEWQKYLSLNLISMASLTSAFLKTFNKDDKTVIVNITSLAAIQPFSGLGEYSVGKASREMYFKVLAAENPKLRILTYSPGPVSTAMIDRCIAKVQDADSKGMFDKMQREGTLVKAEDTIRKLVGLLAAGPSNISRVDYFDE